MLFSSSRGLWPCSCAWLRTNARSSNITGQFTLKFCLSLAISLNMDFLQRVYKSCCYSVAVMILLMYVDNNGIRHNCKESGQEFEKFVMMAMNPGADLDSLPILDNPNNLVVHAYAAFILELSYVAINNLPQLNSSGVTLLPQLQGNACSSLVCQMFCSTVCKKLTFKWTRPFHVSMAR